MSDQCFWLDMVHPENWRQEIETEHTSTDVWNCSMVFQYAVSLFTDLDSEVIAVSGFIAFHRKFNVLFL
jgi:hypothetical protein